MHPSCLEQRIPSSGRGRLTAVSEVKQLEAAPPISRKEPSVMSGGQIHSRLVSSMDGRPRPIRHFLLGARAWLRSRTDRYEGR